MLFDLASSPVSQACGSPPILGPGGPICVGNWVLPPPPPPPEPKCLGIWVRVIICTSRHLGPGIGGRRGGGGGAEFPDAFYLLAPAGFDTIDTFVVTFSTVSLRLSAVTLCNSHSACHLSFSAEK